MEKEDINNEYGTYYDTNGEMRQNVMEVTFYHTQPTFPKRNRFHRSKIGIQHMKPVLTRLMTMTTWEIETYTLLSLLRVFYNL